MEVTEEQAYKIQMLMERFWKDVAGLPWQDKTWVGNEALKQQTRQHFVNATFQDVINVMKGEDDATVPSNDQER